MAADRSTQADILHRQYVPRMQAQFNLRSILMQYIARDVEEYAEGELLSLDLHRGQSGGWGFSSAGILPAPSHQKVARHVYNYNRLYGTIEVSGPHMEGAKTKKASAIKPLPFETSNLIKQMRAGFNHHLFGDGTGKLAGVVSSAAATSIVVDDLAGIVDGSRISVLLSASGSVGGGVEATEVSVNRATKTLTFTTEGKQLVDGGTDVNANPANYTVYRAGSYYDAVNGLEAIVSASNPPTGNLGGIDRTVAGNEFWQANVASNGGVARKCSFPLIADMVSEIEQYSAGEPNLAICGYAVWNQLLNELRHGRRFTGEEKKLNGWAKAIVHDDLPIVRDKHCPPTKMYILDTSMFTLFQNNEGDWIDEDGSILTRVPGRHAFQSSWFRFMQLVCHAPNAQGMIDDLDTSVPAAA